MSLKTDYRDEILTPVGSKRTYNIVDRNGRLIGNNVTFEKTYNVRQQGDEFSAQDINETNGAVNKLSADLLNIFDKVYPVGSYYWTSSNENPQTLFGGTWEKIENVFLLASSNKYKQGTKGGEATHKLTIEEMPSHRHTYNRSSSSGTKKEWVVQGVESTHAERITSYEGGGKSHNNMPPYLAANCWHRTA